MAKAKIDVNDEALRRQIGAPRNRSDATKMIRKVATRLRRIAKARDRIRRIEQEIVQDDIEAIRLCDALYRFAEARRKPDQKKDHYELGGVLEWIKTTRSVLTKDKDEIIAAMEEAGLNDFVEEEKSIKIAALKQSGKTVDGVEERSGELFSVRPVKAGLHVERDWQTGKYSRKANEPRSVMANNAAALPQAAE